MALTSEIEKLQKRWDENPLGLTFAPLAEAYRKAGETARALELLEQGLANNPNYVPAHIVRGRCYLDTQSEADAQFAFLRVTELDPENVIALKALAELSERAGRLPEAVKRLEVLLDVDRNNEEARGQLDRVRELLSNANAAPVVAEPEAPPDPAPEAAAPEVAPPEAAAPKISSFEFSTPNFYSQRAEAAPEPSAEAAAPAYIPMMAEEPVPAPAESFSDDSLGDIELDDSTELSSKPSAEFQIPNDAEALRPSNDRIADVTLGSGSEDENFQFEEAVAGSEAAAPQEREATSNLDSVDALLGEEYASLLAYGPEPEDAPAPPPESAPVSEDSGFVEGFVPVGADVRPPDVDVLPATPEPPFEVPSLISAPDVIPDPYAGVSSEPEVEASPAPEPEWELAAEALLEETQSEEETHDEPALDPAVSESEPVTAENEPELVVTETMAEIFLRQGHRELARAVYTQLALREPDNERIAAALARLTPEPPPAPPAPEPEPAPPFSAAETGGRSVSQLFGTLLSAGRPTPAPVIHPPAFEHPKRASGEPTRPSQESLSLSAVFGDETAPPGPAGVPASSSPGEPSFDEFFAPATGSASDAELPRDPESDALTAQVPEDLEQFNAWLRGLKR